MRAELRRVQRENLKLIETRDALKEDLARASRNLSDLRAQLGGEDRPLHVIVGSAASEVASAMECFDVAKVTCVAGPDGHYKLLEVRE